VVQGRFRLARHQRPHPGRGRHHLDERPVAGRDPTPAGDGEVAVGRDEQRAGRDREAALGQHRVVDAGRVALDDGERLVGRRADRAQAALPQRHPQTAAPDDQDRRTRGKTLGQQPGRGLGGGHHVFGRGRDAEAGQQRGDGGRGAEGVVGHVRQPHARRVGLAQRLRRAGDGGAADVDHPVQVEQGDVVNDVERLPAGSQGHSEPSREPPAFLARSVARTERRASV
jgi:hypothetical protein